MIAQREAERETKRETKEGGGEREIERERGTERDRNIYFVQFAHAAVEAGQFVGQASRAKTQAGFLRVLMQNCFFIL